MTRRKSKFRLTDIESYDVSTKPLEVPIGFLSESDHVDAFVDIFEKILADNRLLFEGLKEVEIRARHPLELATQQLNASGRASDLWVNARSIGRELYFTDNDDVTIVFSGSGGSRELFVVFDDPYFAIDGMQRRKPFWRKICKG